MSTHCDAIKTNFIKGANKKETDATLKNSLLSLDTAKKLNLQVTTRSYGVIKLVRCWSQAVRKKKQCVWSSRPSLR